MRESVYNPFAMIGIITDSTCDIPENLVEQYSIIVIPQVVVWGDEQYRDRIDLSPVDFYERMSVDPVQPHSSLPAYRDFERAYEQAAGQGADELLVLTVSSAMSGTFEMAKRVAAGSNLPVTVVDSKGPTMSLGWQVLAAARAREAGVDLPAILDRIEDVRQRLASFVAMDSLEYLQKGGRIGEAVKWAGTLLKVKPLVMINHETGRVEPVSLARTHHALVNQLYGKFFQQFGDRNNLHIAVLHGNDLEQAECLAERIEREHHPVELQVNMTGPVLGINTGPGALALCGYAES